MLTHQCKKIVTMLVEVPKYLYGKRENISHDANHNKAYPLFEPQLSRPFHKRWQLTKLNTLKWDQKLSHQP